MNRIARVGLTGGMGSGKSTVAHMFSEFGVPILDLDEVGRNLALQPEHLAMLAHTFGDRILRVDDTLNRRELARVCFSDPEETKRLNRIMHPPIWKEAKAWLARQHACYSLIEASVLIESGGISYMDDVVVVLAVERLRRERVLASRDMDATHFNAVVQQQCDDNTRYAAADYVIRNNSNVPDLRATINVLHDQLMQKYSGNDKYN